jgi:hypothetical protein
MAHGNSVLMAQLSVAAKDLSRAVSWARRLDISDSTPSHQSNIAITST